MHKVCPQCHSDQIIGDLFLITGQYKCMNCGYQGAFIITMDDRNYEKLQREDEEEKGRNAESS